MYGGGGDKIPESAAAQEAQRVAIDQWNWHVTKGKPFENAFIQRAALPAEGLEAQASGATNADVAHALNIATAKANPLNRGTMLTPYTKAAGAAAKAIPQAAQAVDDYRTSLVRGYTEMLRGEVPKINQGYLAEAQNAGNLAATRAGISQQNRAITQNTIASGVGTLAGAGSAIYLEANRKRNDPTQNGGDTWFPQHGWANSSAM